MVLSIVLISLAVFMWAVYAVRELNLRMDHDRARLREKNDERRLKEPRPSPRPSAPEKE